tara:strand:+ start:1736 stop:2566 length:831 start_codon:yes stop_codon:yes gene_type:complete
MKYLQQYIRQLLIEVYELDDQQKVNRDSLIRMDYGGKEMAHVAGLDTAEEQREDRELLRRYQEGLLSTSHGKKLIRAFRNGDVTILHDITYEGAAARSGLGGTKNKKALASDWIRKYGRSGNDTLSTIACYLPPTESLPGIELHGNSKFVMSNRGMIMKGYPVFVAKEDVMSQTIGALDDKMKAHWKTSGMPKRPAKSRVRFDDFGDMEGIQGLRHLKKLLVSNETLLDNWTIIGTYIGSSGNSDNDVQAWIADSLSLGLPCNVYNQYGNLTRYEP